MRGGDGASVDVWGRAGLRWHVRCGVEGRGVGLVEDDVGVAPEGFRVVREVLEKVAHGAEGDRRLLGTLVVPAPDLVPHPRPQGLQSGFGARGSGFRVRGWGYRV